ncbi:MAG TPA: hypothetical protein VHS31_02530 [Tepidisphaeraceae bacterium]|jgi:3D (Asp-Asp-Asp) domain-containing protein|nr:hypothetical protein [Tepidisphaeraceae bacterium]
MNLIAIKMLKPQQAKLSQAQVASIEPHPKATQTQIKCRIVPAQAKAFVRGNRDLAADPQFVRVEPNVMPKMSLTVESTKRAETHALQVIYAVAPDKLPVYVGQRIDVYIEAEQGTSR